MDSTTAPSTARRNAVLVSLVWLAAALPFVTGLASCPTARLFHVACPGCGMTRALVSLARGDVAASIAMHPLALPTALAQVALAIATVAATLARGAPWAVKDTRAGRAVLVALAVVLALDVGLWAVRMHGGLGGPVPV
jgi:hypothetical protein